MLYEAKGNEEVKLTISDLNGFNKRMEARAGEISPAMVKATHRAVKHVHEKVPSYPSASHRNMVFVSRKQFIFVLLSIEEGTIRVPYRRTGTLGRTITTEVKELGSTVIGTIGTATVYSPWVISAAPVGDRGPQASYHQNTWFTLQAVVEGEADEIRHIYGQELKKLF